MGIEKADRDANPCEHSRFEGALDALHPSSSEGRFSTAIKKAARALRLERDMECGLGVLVVLRETDQSLNPRVFTSWVALNRISEPCLVVPENIAISNNPIKHCGWPYEFGVIAIALRRVLEERFPADAQRHKVGITESDRLVRVRLVRRHFVIQHQPSTALGDPCRSLPLVSANQADIDTETFRSMANKPQRRRSRKAGKISSPDDARHYPSAFGSDESVRTFFGDLGLPFYGKQSKGRDHYIDRGKDRHHPFAVREPMRHLFPQSPEERQERSLANPLLGIIPNHKAYWSSYPMLSPKCALGAVFARTRTELCPSRKEQGANCGWLKRSASRSPDLRQCPRVI